MTYEELWHLGDEYYANNDYIKALSYFKKANSLKKTSACLNYIACCYIMLEEYDKAFDILSNLVKMEPWERAWFNLGRVYLFYGNMDEAWKCFSKAVEIAPDDCDCYFYLGLYYKTNNEYKKALETYKKSEQYAVDKLDKSDAHLQIGICYNALGIFDKAIKHFDKAYYFDSLCLDALFNKAMVLIKIEKYSNALNTLNFLLNSNYDTIMVNHAINQCTKKLLRTKENTRNTT